MVEERGTKPQLHRILQSIAAQLMNSSEVVISEPNGDEQRMRVTRVGGGRLRTARVIINGREIQAIEQNRTKPSRWGQLARQGHEVVQFQDIVTRKYVAVVVDGEVTEYGR
jgi:hemin uptake protein HemP